MSIYDHSNQWYADTDAAAVTHVHLTSTGAEIGTYEPEDSANGMFWVVVRSQGPQAVSLVSEAFDRASALLTILSRWNLI